MATFLRNLPSFNKDNFSNFQPENNKYLPKKQSIYACNHSGDAFEQLIVNQRCNLVIQYLEKQAKEACLTDATANAASKVARKRDIDQVNKFNSKISSDDDEDDDGESSKTTKKKRTQIDENMTFQQAVLMERHLAFEMPGAGSTNQGADANDANGDNIIEVDDLNPTNHSSASNTNDDEIDV